jgi:hypothetical protein
MTRLDLAEHDRHYRTLRNFGHASEADRGLALLAEIERLTGEVAAERAALLAYLRVDPYLHSRCDAIECGEHRLKN